MKTMIVAYDCKPGKRDAFYQAVLSEGIIQASREEKGNLRYDYCLDLQKENRLILLEKWEDEESSLKHRDQPHFKRLGELKAEFVENTEIEVFLS